MPPAKCFIATFGFCADSLFSSFLIISFDSLLIWRLQMQLFKFLQLNKIGVLSMLMMKPSGWYITTS